MNRVPTIRLLFSFCMFDYDKGVHRNERSMFILCPLFSHTNFINYVMHLFINVFFFFFVIVRVPYKPFSHERKKMYWEQLELRSRTLLRRHHPPPCCGCCQDCRFAPNSNNAMLPWPPWDVLDDRSL